MPRVHYYYVPNVGWLAAPAISIEDEVKRALAEATEAHREVGAMELAGFALLAFTSAFWISMTIMRRDDGDRSNPMGGPMGGL
jgi:hypothetical protein